MPPRTERELPSRSSSLDTVVGDEPPNQKVTTIDHRGYKQLVEYELPPLVRGMTRGWKDACNSIGIITALSSGVLTTLLQILDKEPAVSSRVFICAGIIFSLGATTCAVICLFILSDLTTQARILAATEESSLPRKLLLNEMIHIEYLHEDREQEILRKFGVGWSWFIARTLMLACFLLGAICNFVGFALWVWYQGFQTVVIVSTVILTIVGGTSITALVLLLVGK